MQKYKNRKTTIKGITFDSQLESHVYLKLVDLQRDYNFDFSLQPKYELQKGYDLNGKKIRSINYKGDFEICLNGRKYVLDSKGFETKEFLLKKKLFGFKFGKEIICIKSARDLEKWFMEVIE